MADPAGNASGAICYYDSATGRWVTVSTEKPMPTVGSVAMAWVALTKTVAVPGVAEPLVAVQTFASRFLLTAKKATGANTGNVYLGDSTVNRTSNQQTLLSAGDAIGLDSPLGTKFDLAQLYLDAATAGDGLTGMYLPA